MKIVVARVNKDPSYKGSHWRPLVEWFTTGGLIKVGDSQAQANNFLFLLQDDCLLRCTGIFVEDALTFSVFRKDLREDLLTPFQSHVDSQPNDRRRAMARKALLFARTCPTTFAMDTMPLELHTNHTTFVQQSWTNSTFR